MTDRPLPDTLGRRAGAGLFLGLCAVLLLFVGGGLVSYVNTQMLRRNTEAISHTNEVLSTLDSVVSLAKDAETGQRGFLITGEAHYLEPYAAATAAIFERLDDVKRLTADNPNQQTRIPLLKSVITAKLRELEQTIALRRSEGFEVAREVVMTDRGKNAMDAIRSQVEAMQQEEKALGAQRDAEMKAAYRVAVGSGILTGVLGVLLSGAVAYLLRQAVLIRQRQDWLQGSQIKLSEAMAGDQSLEQLGENILRTLVVQLDAHAGAFFVSDAGVYRRVSTYGVPVGGGTPERFIPGDGLLGRAAQDRQTIIVRNVPDGYLSIGSALGRGSPRHLLIVPATDDRQVNAVLELGFVHPLDDSVTELFERVSENIGVAIRSVNFRTNLQNLLAETQRQAEELQAQSEELRVSNEELAEQGRALKESQGRLENQQAELEQTNSQLEEQSQLLENQRDETNRTNAALEAQARELAQASQYKSDFLANMSHELRTPLNSSLILAKLLADNSAGNLTTEQVRYAETIQTAGNDLLALINDILDLSKIEAGHMELRPEQVRLAGLVDDLARTFHPLADQKRLAFRAHVLPGCPETLETDRQRLEQVLKNLLSNALKFTGEGQVELTVSSAVDDRIAFAVTDTGIGIPADQQQVVFEAFRQADGTTNRKYGGTGLGLSISRELTILLGGDIHVASEPGRGSTFTVTVPRHFAPLPTHGQGAENSRLLRAAGGRSKQGLVAASGPAQREQELAVAVFGPATRRVEDDRDRLGAAGRTILFVEDDEAFARILYELAHELDFHCLIATTAEEGFAAAAQHLPSAVVLDIGLPDHSGLWVLDRLKHDKRTRHIPVHVISADDYAQAALSLGAVGHMLKPVKREELIDALQRLETRLAQRMGRVLVVEDDLVQLDSLRKLLSSQAVETVGAGSAAECLEHLKSATFDCMVLDLTLPDASGYSLLETLSREDAYAFPPVIVYTGRTLSANEEQRLRRYSRSIIIKGAKSPERLLDEVTLFLHRVVSDLPAEQQHMLEKARSRDAAIEGRRILLVEDDVRNVFALTSILEQRGAVVQIARNGREALEALEAGAQGADATVDLVLMDVMMPEMDGIAAMREIRKRPEWKKLPVIMLTAKAMRDDQEHCLAAGANDYMAKPIDVEKLLSLVRVWMSR